MFANNPLLAQLKQQMQENLPKKEGQIKASEKGFGFLEIDSKTRIFIPPAQMKKCLHGDKVSAIIRSENDREFAEPQELIEAALSRFIARVRFFKGRLQVVVDHPHFKKSPLKAKTQKGLSADSLQEGDWVVAHLTQHALTNDAGFLVEISQKITDANDKIAPWWVTLAENNLPNTEPVGLEQWQENDELAELREDLTHLPLVTIDSASTQDMDDALYAQRLEDGFFEVTIAIADPSVYVKAGDSIDKEAQSRGFTIYLPGRNIPMLPRELADDLCSLIQGEVRHALCCRIIVHPDGTINDNIHFFAAKVCSHARLSYDDVSDWLENPEQSQWQPQPEINPVLADLYAFALARAQWRETHAVVFPDRPDYRFELSPDNDVIAVHADYRRAAHRLVEEAMITANICAGKVLQAKAPYALFNVHSGLKNEKIADVVALLAANGKTYDAQDLTQLAGFATLRRDLLQLDDHYLDNRLRKYQTYSEISLQAQAHFAMGLEVYATWTSPIRKYGDIVNHRLLKALLLNTSSIQVIDESLVETLMQQRKHHKTAERNIADWLYVRMLADEAQSEREFEAEIFDITRAGMRVRLTENGASAFVPLSTLFEDKEKVQALGEEGQVFIADALIYRLGDRLNVRLIEVNQESRNLVAQPVATKII